MGLETTWTRGICNEMKSMNALVFAIVGGEMQEPGWPDRYICHRRWHGHIEFKGPRTKVTTKQRLIIRRLRERGANACIVRHPNRIEDEEGKLLATFDGTGRGLLATLRSLDPIKNLFDCIEELYSDCPAEVVACFDSLDDRRGL